MSCLSWMTAPLMARRRWWASSALDRHSRSATCISRTKVRRPRATTESEKRDPILVLFTDSDIIPNYNLVKDHLEWHNRNPQTSAAVLGYVTWSPEVKATPFMRWYGENAIFTYRMLRGQREADFRFFYTCNLSLKTEYLRSCGQFDEDFKTAAYEDLELGYRLSKKGLCLLYNPRALAYHHQFFSFEDACRKVFSNEGARRVFEQKEAGRYLGAERRKRVESAWFRVGTWMAVGIGKAFGRSKRLPDSRVPLPAVIYHSLFWYRVKFRRGITKTANANLPLQSIETHSDENRA